MPGPLVAATLGFPNVGVWPALQRSTQNSERGRGRPVRGGLDWNRGWLLVALVLTIGPRLCAQTTSGIFGTITDQQGLAIVGAEVVVRSVATTSETKYITDSEGSYKAVG